MVAANQAAHEKGSCRMKKTSSLYVLSFMVLTCAILGAGVATIHYTTRPLLEKNEQLHRNRIICNAFLLGVPEKTAAAYEKTIDEYIVADTIMASDGTTIELFRNTHDNAVGFVFSGMGFWNAIHGILVLSGDLSTIRNIQFFDQKETPGLGARIEEQWFTDQFKGLPVYWNEPVHKRIRISQATGITEENHINGITGASQTSMAVMKMINSELERFRKGYKR